MVTVKGGMRFPALRRTVLAPLAGVVLLVVLGCAAGGAVAPRDSSSSESGATPAAGAGKLRLRLVRIASGFTSPVHATATRSESGRIYVVEQAGRIRVIENGRVLPQPFLDIRSLVQSGGEQGLLSLAFHPNYAENRLFFVNYTNTNGDTRVVEYRASDGAAPERVRELLAVDQPYANHNGGQLAFGPDGLLYVGMGDGGSGGDPGEVAQDLSSRLGKMLRRDVDRSGSDWEIVGYGLRNPWRFSFDRQTGNLYMGDVGHRAWEEIDVTTTPGTGLENYGWDALEGSHPYEDERPNQEGTLVGPAFEYGHDKGCSVTGGFVYRGQNIPAAKGRYFFGDYCGGFVWSFVYRNGQATALRKHPFKVNFITSFGETARGELLLVSHEGAIYRLARR